MDIGKLCGVNADKFEQVKTWLATAPHTWLLIIDNADNPKIDYADFFPTGNIGSIILTTRNPQCRGVATAGYKDLDHLDPEDAKLLLFKAAGIADSSREDKREAAEKVVQALGSHTLAIVQAGAFIRIRHCPLEDYPSLLRNQEELILKYCLKQEQSTYGSVYATFEISATHLESSPEQSAADALSLLGVLGFFHFQEIPESMFSRAREEAMVIREKIRRMGPRNEIYQLSDTQISRLPAFMMQEDGITVNLFLWRWRQTLDILESYSLIKIAGSGEDLSFSMHPLAHTWTRIRLKTVSQQEGWRAAGSVIALSVNSDDYDRFYEIRSHAIAYLDHPIPEYIAEMTELEVCQTHYVFCFLFLDLPDASKCRFLLNILETLKTWTGARGSAGMEVKRLTAYCLMKEGNSKGAVELLEPLVEIDRSKNLSTQDALARGYLFSKQYQKAVNMLEHIVKIREKTEWPEDHHRNWSEHNLGMAYFETKRYESAVTILERVVDVGKKILVDAHPIRLVSEKTLGAAYIETNQHAKAARILQRVFEIQRAKLDAEDPSLLDTQHNLAMAYIRMGTGHYEMAAELLERVVDTERKTLAPDDPNLLASQHNLAVAYLGMGSGHYEKAAKVLEQVVEVRKTLAPDDPNLLASQHNLAVAYLGMGSGHYEKAAELLEKVVGIRQETLAPDHPHLLDSQQLLEEVHELIQAEKDGEATPASAEAV